METRALIYPCLALCHHTNITDKAKETKQAEYDSLIILSICLNVVHLYSVW